MSIRKATVPTLEDEWIDTASTREEDINFYTLKTYKL